MKNAFHGISQPLLDPRFYDKPVHDDLDIVLDIFIQGDLFGKFVHISIYTHTDITAFFCTVKQLCMRSLPAPHDRRQKLDPCALRESHDLIYHLIHSLFSDLASAFWTVGDPYSRIEQTEIIINLRHSPHCGPWIVVCRLLIDRDRRGKSFDAFHIRLFHLPQELPRIGRQGFHISPLPLCVDRIKRKRRFSRTAQPRQDHKFIPRDIHIYIFKVVLIRPTYPDILPGVHLFSHHVSFLFYFSTSFCPVHVRRLFLTVHISAFTLSVSISFNPSHLASSSDRPAYHAALPQLRSSVLLPPSSSALSDLRPASPVLCGS